MAIGTTVKRRLVQSLSLLVLNANLLGLNLASQRICLPVMNCQACAGAWLGCPIYTLSAGVAFLEIPILVLAVAAGVALLAGRFLCGWVCPFGFLQDLLHKIPSPKFAVPRPLTWVKYGVLLVPVLLVAFFLTMSSGFFYCNFCPTSALEVVLPRMLTTGSLALEPADIAKLSVLAVVLVLAVMSHRSFCKVICPVGALIAVGNKFSLFRLRLDKDRCVSCRKCDKTCPMGVPVLKTGNSGRSVNRNLECIECLGCEQVCPTRALSNNSRVVGETSRAPSGQPVSAGGTESA